MTKPPIPVRISRVEASSIASDVGIAGAMVALITSQKETLIGLSHLISQDADKAFDNVQKAAASLEEAADRIDKALARLGERIDAAE